MHTHKKSIPTATWDDALRDAKAQLAAAKARVRELSAAVKVCERRVKTREAFPVGTSNGVIGQGGD